MKIVYTCSPKQHDSTGPEPLKHEAPKLATQRVVVKIRVPFLGTLNNRCRIITGTQKGTLILTTTPIAFQGLGFRERFMKLTYNLVVEFISPKKCTLLVL